MFDMHVTYRIFMMEDDPDSVDYDDDGDLTDMEYESGDVDPDDDSDNDD